MSMQNMVTGSDEDDHYLPGQFAHPNKALRKSLDDPHDSNMENDSDPEHATPRMRSGKRPQLPSQLDALTNSSAATISLSGASMQEQIRLAKDQAIEILRVLDAENMLEHGIDDYINDVESSYGSDTSGPKATFPKLRAAWTREEDRLLMVGVRVYGPNTESWPRIAMLVPGRTNKSCRKRWFHSLDPSLHKGPWTNEEDALLRQRVMQFPAQWSRVAEGITGRTDDQCAKRWRESLDPDIDRTKWRSEEDRLLLEKYKEYGTQWQKIATFFHGRPGLHCRNRWRKIQRIITQKERKSGPITPDDLTETLATVTESVNRRKTAQRSRLHQQQEIVDGLHATGQKKMSLKAQRRSQSQEQLYGVAPLAAPTEPAPAPIAAFGDGDSQLGAMRSYAAPPPPPLPQLRPSATRHMLGSSPPHETMGALFMPSDQHSTMAGVPAPAPAQLKGTLSFRAGTPGGAKRSASMLFSPTEEQRLRLKHLGLKLYGCAAAPEQCNVVFADSASLNSHLKLCHPQVACLIPSLCNGTSAGYVGGLQQGLEISAQNSDGSDAATGSVAGGKGLRPYRCAMPDCNHAYKNVSGLEYHIFQSRKSNNHLMRDSPVADGLDGGGADGHVPDVAMTERGAVFDNLIHGSVAIPGDNIMGGALALTSPSQAGGIAGSPVLQCVEVDCLARFSSEYGLRQHVAMQHPRPIRRAVKPSNRVKPGRGTPTEQMSPSASFWNTTTISDVLGTAAAMDAGPGQAMGLASMPTIPESAISTPVSQSMEAAMAAAMGYGAEAQGLALNGAGQPLGRGRAVPQAAHRRLMLQGLPVQPFLQATAAPFLSAPALINASGGEPNIGSYFSLGLNNAGTSDTHHPMTPTIFGVPGNVPMSNESMDAAAASMMLEAMNQAAAGNEGHLNQNPATQQGPAAHEGDGDANMATNYLQDNISSLNMQLMHSMMSNSIYVPRDNEGGGQLSGALADEGNVQMDDMRSGQPHYSRSQRSDSFDLSSVATVPSSSSSSTIQPSSMATGDSTDPLATSSTGSKSGAHSQIATALMSKRSRQQQQQQQQIQQQSAASSQAPVPAAQQPGLLPWTHGFSALGLLPYPGDAQNRQAMSDGFPQPQQRLYTPQPTDLAQFQFHTQAQSMQQDVQQPIAPNSAGPRYQRQFVSTLQLGQLQSQHPPPLYSSNSIIQCPVFACRQAFSDANALKHHLGYDHPRDAPMMSANASNPGSPMEGFLSTMPTNHQTPMFSMAVGPLSAGAPMQNRQGMQYLDPDRSKAPHWIDTNMWSSWIAAANGQGDVTAVAAATAMGITPGISGPQSFIPAASTPLTQPTYSQATSELLQMFQAVNRADTS
ncbi:hypothetical protein H4218_004213 [Coemansia sp. IMI 209128]|nr:hypothetical protein H4218_004213 [Coemansia sp. IMI 209128]